MSKKKIIISSIVLFLICSIVVSAQKRCMFICTAPGTENAEYDKYIIPYLDSWGYSIDKHYAVDLPKYTEKDYAPYDFIFLSESVKSNEMLPLREIPKPMLCSDGWAAKISALAFCSDEQVGILEPAQPIVFLEKAATCSLGAGYSPGTVIELGTVLVRKDPCLIVWAKPTIPIIPIAGVESDSSRLIVYGIEKGTKNEKGQNIKNRVAVVGLHAWGYKVITEDGARVFKEAIEWVMKENLL